jgi:hypothetical protein
MAEEEKTQTAGQESSPAVQKIAINFLIRFYIVFKVLKLYAENNEI